MITAYVLDKKGNIVRKKLSATARLPRNTLWIDLFQPTVKEEEWIHSYYKVSVPSSSEMDKIEVTSPFYQENQAYYLTVTAIDKSGGSDYMNSSAITFIMTEKCLITLRYDNPDSIAKFISYVSSRKKNLLSSPDGILMDIIDVLVNASGDVLERTGNALDLLLKGVFEKDEKNETNKVAKVRSNADYYNGIIKRIGMQGNVISKSRESLVSINRMLIYISQLEDTKYMAKKDQKIKIRNLNREIHSMNEYANFLAQRNAFLLDATLGMISVEQSMIIKIFTVAAAVFMPPTLIASIYGMNFRTMPELEAEFGYPLVIIAIVISAILPYLFFKRKGWL